MFSSRFWENDFVTQTGFETIAARLKDGGKTCKDIEDFLKQRAKAEEDFAKALQKIAKSERGAGETGSIKSSVDVLRAEADAEANFHAKHAQYLADEANRLSEFRERQREERRRHEEVMHRVHKTKADSFRKMQSCKSTYESKYRAAEKADSDYERVKFSTKPKEVERAKKSQQQSLQAATKADEEYKSSVEQLEIYRKSWEQEHRSTCEIFQRLEEERLQNLRNMLWIFANLGSELFVNSDDSREKIRASLERCDLDNDLMDFANRKGTGTRPLDPIPYVSCATGVTSVIPQSPNIMNSAPVMGRPRVQDEYSLADTDAYSMIGVMGGNKKAIYDYTPQQRDEIQIAAGDAVIVKSNVGGGWLRAKNVRTGQEGLIPATYVTD